MTRLGEDGKVNGMYDDIGGKMSLTVKWCVVMFLFFLPHIPVEKALVCSY